MWVGEHRARPGVRGMRGRQCPAREVCSGDLWAGTLCVSAHCPSGSGREGPLGGSGSLGSTGPGHPEEDGGPGSEARAPGSALPMVRLGR